METELDRSRTLAFSRLLGHLLGDGSISSLGQGRMSVGQAVDREMVLNDIELTTGLRPVANRYDERRWSIVLPMVLTKAITSLPGVQVGVRIRQIPTLPGFVCDPSCPVSVVREFLGGVFGADGHAPSLHRYGKNETDAVIEPPAYSQSTIPPHVEQCKKNMWELTRLLAKCGVNTDGAEVYEYPTRRGNQSYAPAIDGIPRIEVRLSLGDGLSFIEHVGFRYCVDKMMKASAAAAYWRMVNNIREQRLWMANQLKTLHQERPSLSFSKARQIVAAELIELSKESLPPASFPHYALLEGNDRFSRLPTAVTRKFHPIHRDVCDFLSPVELFEEFLESDNGSRLSRQESRPINPEDTASTKK